jgi:caffeoyl-CoA O-methyltransferase
MMVSESQGEFLSMLVRLTGAIRVLEIGTYTGYSALCMASALPPGGRLVTCEVDPDMARVATGFLERASEQGLLSEVGVGVRVGPAMTTLEALERDGASFDLVFIDADKRGYGKYHEALMGGGLVVEGGLLVYDNIMFKGRVIAAEQGEASPKEKIGPALHQFNLNLAADTRLRQRVVLPAWDGLTLAQKAFATTKL